MDYPPYSGTTLRAWALLLSFVALFVLRALAAWLFRAWQRHRATRAAAPRLQAMQEPRDTVAGRWR